MALTRKLATKIDYHQYHHKGQVTIMSHAEWGRIKARAKTVEETDEEELLKKEKADEKKERRELEEQYIANAKNKMFCESESVRRFHSALQLASVLKEREVQVQMRKKIKDVEDEHLKGEELARNRDGVAHDEFHKYTEEVMAAAAESKLNLIPLVRAVAEGKLGHGNGNGPVIGEVPELYEPVFEKGVRKKVGKKDSLVVDVDIPGLGFSVPEKPPEYVYPNLESRRIGRYTTALLDTDLQDKRVNFPKRESELTKFMIAHWTQKTDRN